MSSSCASNHRRVVILGAGATAGCELVSGAQTPLVTNLLLKAGAELIGARKIEASDFQCLDKFTARYYGFEATKCDRPVDVEEVLTAIEVAKKYKARDQLLRFIGQVLDDRLKSPPTSGSATCQHHAKLLYRLTQRDTIITFNWDLLLDNQIVSNREDPDYGSIGIDLVHSSQRTFPVPLLKLHGSFNWEYCPHCKKAKARLACGKIGLEHIGGVTKCSDCKKSNLKPVIVAPTLNKRFLREIFEQIWKKAGKSISDANEIMIVGYSLPPTDFKARWMIRDALASRPEVPKLSRVRIFDKCPCPLMEKYNDLFGRYCDRDIEYVAGGIREAAEQFGVR